MAKLTEREEWWLARQFYWIRFAQANHCPKLEEAAVDTVIELLKKVKSGGH